MQSKGRPGTPGYVLAERIEEDGFEPLLAVQTGPREAWAAECRTGGFVCAVLLASDGAGGYVMRRQGAGLDRTDCPAEVFKLLTEPDASTPEGEWHAMTKLAVKKEDDWNCAETYFFPDGIMTEYGALHWASPIQGMPDQMEPVYDPCTKQPVRRLNVMITRSFAQEAGCIPLRTWKKDVWEAVSCAVAVLDYRRCSLDREELPAVKSNVDLMLNGASFPKSVGGFKAGAMWVTKPAPGIAEMSCGDLSAVWESGMRGKLICGTPVKIVEIVRVPRTGRDVSRVRYPLAFDGTCPWVRQYEKALAK